MRSMRRKRVMTDMVLLLTATAAAMVFALSAWAGDCRGRCDGGETSASAVAIAGADADARSSSSSRNTNVNLAAGGSAHQGQGQLQGQSARTGDVQIEGDVVEGDTYVESAYSPSASSSSVGGDSPCGDSTGVAAAGRPFGASVGTVPETCRVYRLKLLRAEVGPDDTDYQLALGLHRAGFPFRLLLHIATFGILH